MIGIRVGDVFLDLEENTKMRLQLTSPLISRNVTDGEYSFPFRIPASPTNLRSLGYEALLEVENRFSEGVEAFMYIESIMFSKGVLQTNYQGKPFIDCNLLMNSSVLATIKNLTLKDFDWGNQIDISDYNQFIEIRFENDWIGNTIHLYVGDQEFFQAVTTTVNAALILLVAQINAATFYGSYTVISAVGSSSNNLAITANWTGLIPEMLTFLVPVTGTTASLVNQYQGKVMYNQLWNNHMNWAIADTYPNRKYTFFPVRNEDCKIPWSMVDPEAYGNIPVFIQNYYDSQDGEWIPYFESNVSAIPETYRSITCPTPFLYITHILDVIFKKIFLQPQGFFHDQFDNLKLVLWSNVYVDYSLNSIFVGGILTDKFNIVDTLPDHKVSDLLQVLCDTFCLGIVPTLNGTAMSFVQLRDVLNTSQIVDWSRKVDPEYKKYSDKVEKGVKLEYDLDNEDGATSEKSNALEKYQFLGTFPEVVDLPEISGPRDAGNYLFAFVISTSSFYLRKNSPPSFVWTWEVFEESHSSLFFGEEDEAISFAVSDAFINYKGLDEISGAGFSWKIPMVKEHISHILSNKHVAKIKPRLLQYLGLQPCSTGDTYPMGSSDNVNYDEDFVGTYDLRLENHDGLVNTFWLQWINFLLNSKKVEMLIDLNILDIMTLDYSKRIHINGSNYLIYELQPELPIKKPTLVTLLKIP